VAERELSHTLRSNGDESDLHVFAPFQLGPRG